MDNQLVLKVNDKVWSSVFGWGKVIFANIHSIWDETSAEVLVEFDAPGRPLHNGDGRGKEDCCYWYNQIGVYDTEDISIVIRKDS